MADKPALQLTLAKPRGFCAGVDRAVLIVEQALAQFGAPVYVRHEIVHNRRVVDRLRGLGAIFVDELDKVPDDKPVIFSAHGVPKAVPQAANARGLNWLDATCPLVSKVHIETERHFDNERHILLIGHAGHPEVIGTMGQVPENAITLIETLADAQSVTPPAGKLAYATQTTLSVSDTADIVAALKQRFPDIVEPHKDDICYATTNRQEAVQQLAAAVERVLVIGAPNSSNSQRLVEVARQAGCPRADLIGSADDIDWAHMQNISHVGLTAGASAPEEITLEVIDAFAARFTLSVNEMDGLDEHVSFKLPRQLRSA
ncbi:MAG: 4-hydroxy-3-methylbut-2-enyl diphosphate reductase [Alphaproteobacteria bacterium]|jgi:4-hydroxy-3-methylbut-2-enyl diphosphate reductase|nr:4-hydroxy-3-methylbut-2-enyl diphosphate reductase [Alphaproteobacteria bacterium]